jgi:D-beta-D-heptose 7-phosphate kinase / D-beta-D-heptose 1-phosphate adenosyltransferase
MQSCAEDVSKCLSTPSPVLIVGDLVLDEYLSGDVSRVAFDHPIPVLNYRSLSQALGGAANVAHNLLTLSGAAGSVILVGAVGGDKAGSDLIGLLSAQGISIEGVQVIPGRPTTQKTRVAAQAGHLLMRIDSESTDAIPQDVELRAVSAIRRHLRQVRGIICSDSGKGFLTANLLQSVIREARLLGVPVVVDPKGSDLERYVGASVMTPNLRELGALTNMPTTSSSAVDAAAVKFLRLTGADALVVTCGSDGVVTFQRQGEQKHEIPAWKLDGSAVRDPNGAGDSFIAAFGLAYFSASADLGMCAHVGNVAGALAVMHHGTHAVRREALLNELCQGFQLSEKVRGPPSSTKNKIVDLETLLSKLDIARSAGRKIVFTNGCFDLLHAGHLHTLEVARSFGDILVVGLNTDASIRRIKGDTRPIVPGAERAQALAATFCVDLVVFFDEETPIALIQAVKPDVLVKGGDYAGRKVVGQAFVEASGGRVELVPLVDGLSTTKLVQRILEQQSVNKM